MRVSSLEENFLIQSVIGQQRLDGRKADEFRNVKVHFGSDWGTCLVSLGNTKVLANVSCELGLPKVTRPHEGMLHISVEMGSMMPITSEAGRNSEFHVQINRTLERIFKESRCIDLESLCVTVDELVWILRVDVNVLNNEGNIIDCCSIATLCALMHFRRPDVSIIDDKVHVHPPSEKDPIPIVLQHCPVSITFGLYENGTVFISDPTILEERTAESLMILGVNSYREVCCINLGGSTLTSPHLLMHCTKRAADRAKIIVDIIKKRLANDETRREAYEKVGFAEIMRFNNVLGLAENTLSLKLRNFEFNKIYENKNEVSDIILDDKEVEIKEQTFKIKWVPDDDTDIDMKDTCFRNNSISDNSSVCLQ